MSDWAFEPLEPQPKKKTAPAPKEPVVTDFEPIGIQDLPAESAEMLKIYDDPKAVLETMQAGMAISGLTGIDVQTATDNFEPISEELYGEKLPAKGIFQRIGKTLQAANLNHEISRRTVNQFLDISTPANDAKIKELQAQLPPAEEQLGMLPNAVVQFIYQYGYELPKAAVTGTGFKEKTPVQKITSVMASALGMSAGAGIMIPLARVTRETTEQSIGSHHRALLDAGVNENTARVVTGVLAGIDTALNAIPIGRAATAGERFGAKLAAKGVSRALLKGAVARVALEAGEQVGMAVAQSTANVVATEIAKAVHNQATEEKLPMKRADEILAQIGIEAIPQAVMGTAIAGVSIAGAKIYQFRTDTPAGKAVQSAAEGKTLLRQAQTGEVAPPKLEIAEPTRVKVEPAVGERAIGTIMDITDAQATALDAAVKSAESSADYVPPPGMTRREVIAEYRQTLDDRKSVNKLIRDIKKIDTTGMRDEFAEPVKNILEDFTSANMREKTVERLQKIQADMDLDPNVEIAPSDRKRLGELGKIPLAKLAIDDLQLVHDSLMHYSKLAKESQKIKVGNLRRDVLDTVTDALRELPTHKKIQEAVVSSQPTISKELASGVRKAKDFFGPMQDHYDLLVERLGPTSKKAIFDDVHAGNMLKEKYAQDRTAEFQTATAPLWKKYKSHRWLNEYQDIGQVTTPEGGKATLKLSRSERMALYMHAQDPQNARHILEGGIGFKWREGERNRVYQIDAETLGKLVKSVADNADEMIYVKASQDMFRRNGSDLDKTYYELNDLHLSLRDSYYPIETMPVGRGKEAEAEMAFDLSKSDWARVGLFKGMTERRVNSKIPIYLNPITFDLQKALDHTSAYIGLEAPLRNASKLLYAKDFKESVQSKLGNDYWKFVEKGLKDIAGQRENYGMLEGTALSLRNKIATATLGLNPFPILLQPLSVVRYSQYVKPKYLMGGVMDSVMHPKLVSRTHRLWSPEYVTRTGKGFSREVADVIRQGGGGQAFGQGQKLRSKFMKGLQVGDQVAVMAGMEGAVRQVLDEFRTGKLSPEVKKALQIDSAAGLSPEQKLGYAYKYADYVTERTQSMGLPEFQSTMQRGSAFQKMFTLFGSEAAASMNMRRQAYFEAKKTGTPQAWSKYVKAVFLTVILEPMGMVIRDRLRTAAKGEKQEDIEKDIAERLINAPFEGLPIVRDVVNAATRKMIKGEGFGSSSILPIQRVADVASKAIVAMSDIATAKSRHSRKKAALKSADALAEFISLGTGMPYRPVYNLTEMGIKAAKRLTE
jgi:hypothetical protein